MYGMCGRIFRQSQPGGRDGRVGARGSHQVDGRVGRQLALAEHGVEVLPLVPREEEVVVRELRILAVEAELEHQAGAGRLELGELAQERRFLAQQLVVGRDDLHVRHHDVGGVELPVPGDDALDPVTCLAHLGDLAVQVHDDTELVHEPAEPQGDAIKAAVHVPEVVAELDGGQAVE